MEGHGLVHAIVEECSGGQPSYNIKIFHDGEGKCYFRGGWPKFFADYGLREGWSLIFSRHHRAHCRRLLLRSLLHRLGVSGEHPQCSLVEVDLADEKH
jgi:hypothetical protein